MRIPEGLRAFIVGSRIVLRGPLDQWCGRGVIMLDRSFLVDPADDRLEAGSQALLSAGVIRLPARRRRKRIASLYGPSASADVFDKGLSWRDRA